MKLVQNNSSGRSITIGEVGDPVEFSVERFLLQTSPTVAAGPDFYSSETLASTSGGAWHEYRIFGPLDRPPLSITPINSVGFTIESDRIVKAGSGGRVRVKVSNGKSGKIFTGSTASGAKTVNVFSGYKSGTLARDLADAILDRVTVGKQQSYFTDYASPCPTPLPSNYTPNTNCWAAGIDLSGCAVSTTMNGGHSSANRGGLITPRHVLAASHWNGGAGLSKGNVLRFRGTDGSMHSRTVIGAARHFLDINVVTLNEVLPETVNPFPIAGNWLAQFQNPSNYYMGGIFFYVDQQYRCYYIHGTLDYLVNYTRLSGTVGDYNVVDAYGYTVYSEVSAMNLSPPDYLVGKTAFHKTAVTGDSGSPILALVGSQPVLVGTWFSSTSAPALWNDNGAVVNAIIALADSDAGVSTGLTVTVSEIE
jgi:hypothetical protein